MKETFGDSLQGTERDLGLPVGFLASLLDDDSDWSFVIKIHSLLEVALTHLLTTASGHTELLQLFGRLNTSDPRLGKLAFAKAMKLVNHNQAVFIQKMSELRNRLVHDVRNVSFTFTEYVESLTESNLRSFSRAITVPLNHIIFGTAPDAPRIEGTKNAARFLVWTCATAFVMDAYSLKLRFELERFYAEQQKRRLGQVDPSYGLTIRDVLGHSKKDKSET